jgi:putative ABC transport system ATP-binding protein
MINLSNIDFAYPNSDFRLQVQQLGFSRGSRTAVIGPSGFGKTTLLNLISGICIPQAGTIEIDDHLVHSMTDRDRRTFRLTHIGFIFQDFKLLEYLKVMDNILLPFRINNALKMNSGTKSRAEEIASMLNIAQKLYKFPGKLSQGEKQRVAICRALLNDPSIILADEPTGNLDPENKRMIMHMLFDYVKEKGSTLVTVTHDHELLKGFDDIVDFKDLYKSRS